MTKLTDDIERLCATFRHNAQSLGRTAESLQGLADEEPQDLTELLTAYQTLKESYELYDKALKKVYHFKDRLEKGILPDMMETAGLDQARVPSIAKSFSVRHHVSASFIDADAGAQWLRDIGQGDLIKETVNAGTLSTFVRNMILEEGIDPPEDIVRVGTYRRIGATKYNPTKTVKG